MVALAVSGFLGICITVSENCIILPVSPFEKNTLSESIVSICLWDTIVILILSLPCSRGVNIAASFCVFFARGLVIGCTAKILVGNSVTYAAVFLLAAYCIVTFLIAVYDVFLNSYETKSLSCRVLTYLVATGSAAVIRFLPIIFML